MKTGKGQLVCLSRLVVAAHAFVLRLLHGGFHSPAVPHAFAVPIQGSLSLQRSGESMPPARRSSARQSLTFMITFAAPGTAVTLQPGRSVAKTIGGPNHHSRMPSNIG